MRNLNMFLYHSSWVAGKNSPSRRDGFPASHIAMGWTWIYWEDHSAGYFINQMCVLSLLCQQEIGTLFLHQIFYYLSLCVLPAQGEKNVKNQQKYFPLHWSAWKNFGLCSSHRMFQNYSPQLMDLKTAEHWLLCIKAHVQVSLSIYLSVLQDQG